MQSSPGSIEDIEGDALNKIHSFVAASVEVGFEKTLDSDSR